MPNTNENPSHKHHDKREPLNGVFSSQEVRKVGTGTTTKKTIQKALWFAHEQADGTIEVQPINLNYVPSGPKKKVSMEDFLASFSPEPEVYVTNVYPQMRELNKTIARADRHRKNHEHFSAEMEYGNALKVDEENVRANFGLGITYLERGETAKADNIFERLVKLEAAFDSEHKHLFNEFGINLRKSGMLDQAIIYYNKAVELEQKDEHLFHNIARAYLDKKDIDNALTNLLISLKINPTLEASVKFLMWLITKNLVPEERKTEAAEAIKLIKSATASSTAPQPTTPQVASNQQSTSDE